MKVLDFIARAKVEQEENWVNIVDQVPYLSFPPTWEIAIIPPFAGAVARFKIKLVGGDHSVSVYLDWHDRLGYRNQPYWEAYPIDDDTARFDLDEGKQLIKAIDMELHKAAGKP